MMYVTQFIRGATLVSSLALFGYTTAAAQDSTHAQRATSPHVRNTPKSRVSPRESEQEPKVTSFRGIASKLNTTPEALERAFQTARAANSKLTRSQFIAANVLAQNLGTKNRGITTQAILDGLKSGKSTGKTLQSLGLSAKDADEAQEEASREIRHADRQPAERQREREPKDSTRERERKDSTREREPKDSTK